MLPGYNQKGRQKNKYYKRLNILYKFTMNLYEIDSELLKKVPVTQKEKKPRVRKSKAKAVEEAEAPVEEIKEPVQEQSPAKEKPEKTEKQLAALAKRREAARLRREKNKTEKIAQEVTDEITAPSEQSAPLTAPTTPESIGESRPKKRKILPRPDKPKKQKVEEASLMKGLRDLIDNLKKDSTIKGEKKEINNEARMAAKSSETLDKLKNEITTHRQNLLTMIFPNRVVR